MKRAKGVNARWNEFRLIRSRNGEDPDSEELYDLRPGGSWHRNVAAEHPDIVAALRALAD